MGVAAAADRSRVESARRCRHPDSVDISSLPSFGGRGEAKEKHGEKRGDGLGGRKRHMGRRR